MVVKRFDSFSGTNMVLRIYKANNSNFPEKYGELPVNMTGKICGYISLCRKGIMLCQQ